MLISMRGRVLGAMLLMTTWLGAEELTFPVTPELFNDQFQASEGITFNGEGKLFVGANRAVWQAEPDGTMTLVTAVFLHLGMAGIGERDILAADFGPTVMLRDGPNVDGIIWRITPDGNRRIAARGIPDPNFIVVHADGSYLVSDDFTHNIFLVTPQGECQDGRCPQGKVELWSDAVPHPNGLAYSLDGSILYAAQIFTGLAPLGFSDALWAIPVADGKPSGESKVVKRTGNGGLDGLSMDKLGRIYIAENGGGKIWRFDPTSDELVLIAENMPSVASMVFGEGDFDHQTIFATSTFRGGGKVWKVRVGIEGAPVIR